MSKTLLQARTWLRTILREPTANQWADSDLNSHIEQADWAEFVDTSLQRNSGYGEIAETITLAANATSFSLTPGTPPTGLTYNLESILFIQHQGVSGFWSLCNEIQESDEFRYMAQNVIVATGDVPPLYRLRRPNIVFLPAAAADRTLKIVYRPRPVALSADGTALNSPDVHFQLVVTRAAIFAMAQLGEQETQFDTAYEGLKQEKYRSLVHPNAEGRTLTVKAVESCALFSQ